MGEFKIRVLPRGDEKSTPIAPVVPSPKSELPVAGESPDSSSSKTLIYVAGVSLAVLGALLWLPQEPAAPTKTRQLSSTSDRINAGVNKHLQEAELKREMMIHQSEIENFKFKDAADNSPSHPEIWTAPEDRILGVDLESDKSAEEVFEDLNESKIVFNDNSPQDRINARLATRQWVNQTERAERIAFLANFIRSAYDQGYELQINQDLIVTGVKKVNRNRPVNINQVIDRLAKGQ